MSTVAVSATRPVQRRIPEPVLPESVTIHNRSCENMVQVADESVSLVVTSPPYLVDPADYTTLLNLLDRCFAEVWRVLKPGGFACINVASTIVKGVVYPLPSDLLVRLRDAGWEVKEELIWRRWRVWDHRAGSLLKHPYPGYFFPNHVHEHVFVLKKPGPPIYSDKHDDQKWASAVMDAVLATRPEKSPEKTFYTGELANSVWNILPVQPQRKEKGNGNHPCPFPEELAYRLVTLYSYRGDLVLDPFCGSGTVAKVAHRLGRKFVGYEVNSGFVTLAKQRVLDVSPIKREQRVAWFASANMLTEAGRFADVSRQEKPGDKPADFCYGCGKEGRVIGNQPRL